MPARPRSSLLVRGALALLCGALGCSSSSTEGGAGAGGVGAQPPGPGAAAGSAGVAGTGVPMTPDAPAGTAGAGGSSSVGGTSGGGGTSGSGGLHDGGGGAPGGGGQAAAGGQAGAAGADGAAGTTRSPGCGKNFTRPNAGDLKTISVGGQQRTYQFFVPPSYQADTAYPLVVTFHGGGGSAASSRAEMHLESANSPGLVIYLNYVNNGWSYAAGSPDIAYYEAVRAEVEQAYCVDTNRVLVTGFSLGAIQTNGIGCTLGGKSVRAIVPIDGSGPYPQPAPPSEAALNCPAGTPVGDPAVMVIHGSNDTTALYKYGQWTANYWRQHLGCQQTPVAAAAPLQGCVTYQGCRAPMEFCTHSGNHEVPSSAGGWVWAFLDLLP